MIDRSTNPPTDTGPVIAAAQSRRRLELALDAAPRIAKRQWRTSCDPEPAIFGPNGAPMLYRTDGWLTRAPTRTERLRSWLRDFWENLL